MKFQAPNNKQILKFQYSTIKTWQDFALQKIKPLSKGSISERSAVSFG
jgi:hypothetical protein